jgi:glutaminyl-tRNA synthetase
MSRVQAEMISGAQSGKNFLQSLNPDSSKVLTAYVEPSPSNAQTEQKFRLERHSYFEANRVYDKADKSAFNLVLRLADSCGK